MREILNGDNGRFILSFPKKNLASVLLSRQVFFHRFPARKNVHIFSAAILAEQPFDKGTGVKLNERLPVATG